MAETVGLTASVIAVATLAWKSSKTLYELLKDLDEVPEIISNTRYNLS